MGLPHWWKPPYQQVHQLSTCHVQWRFVTLAAGIDPTSNAGSACRGCRPGMASRWRPWRAAVDGARCWRCYCRCQRRIWRWMWFSAISPSASGFSMIFYGLMDEIDEIDEIDEMWIRDNSGWLSRTRRFWLLVVFLRQVPNAFKVSIRIRPRVKG